MVETFPDDGDGVEDAPVAVQRRIPRRRGHADAAPRRAQVPAPPPPGDDDVPYSTGGKPVRDAGAPWQAQVYYPNTAPQWSAKLAQGTPLWQLQHYCGGALIAPDWVLTAAHCIDEDMVKAGYRVRLGRGGHFEGRRLDLQDRPHRAAFAVRLEASSPATPNMYANDIALIHIVDDGRQPPRDPTRMRAIPLYRKPVPRGAPVTGTGWGKTEAVEGHAPSAVLLKSTCA